MFSTEYFWLIIYGFIAGVIGKSLFPGKDEGGLFLTALLGIMGSVVGGFVYKTLGFEAGKGFSLPGIIPAVVGTMVVLACWKLLIKFFKG